MSLLRTQQLRICCRRCSENSKYPLPAYVVLSYSLTPSLHVFFLLPPSHLPFSSLRLLPSCWYRSRGLGNTSRPTRGSSLESNWILALSWSHPVGQTHMHTHAHTHTHVYIHTLAHAHTSTHICAHINRRTHECTHAHNQPLSLVYRCSLP